MNFDFLKTRAGQVLTILLIAQAAAVFAFSRPEVVPPGKPLALFPDDLGAWKKYREGFVDEETQKVLQADDVITREYGNGKYPASLFIAAFRSQRTGKAPHSPKNCLPGNGWVQQDARIAHVPVSGRDPIEVNWYIVAKGDSRSLVAYWYQSRDRAVANEYKAKYYVMLDALRYNRTDTALIRVVLPAVGDRTDYEQAAVSMIQSVYPHLQNYLPH